MMFFKHSVVRFQIVLLLVVFLMASGCSGFIQPAALQKEAPAAAIGPSAAEATDLPASEIPMDGRELKEQLEQEALTTAGSGLHLSVDRPDSVAPSGTHGVSWGPSYDTAYGLIPVEPNRSGLDFTMRLDHSAITGVKWGPSYYADDEVAGTNRGEPDFIEQPGANVASGVKWGPSYYADDQNVVAGANVDSFMKQIDQNALTGKTWGPSYAQ